MTNHDHSVLLVGHSVVLMPPDSAPQSRADALDSLQYCQLLACKQAGERFDHPDAWAAAYRQAFAALSWIRTVNLHEQLTLGADGLGADDAPLATWFKQRQIAFDALRETVADRVCGHAAGLDHLLRFAVRQQADRADVSVEFALLGSGPSLDLCSVAWRSEQPVTRDAFAAALRHLPSSVEVSLRAMSLNLNTQAFASRRAALRGLVEQKERDQPRRLDLGVSSHE